MKFVYHDTGYWIRSNCDTAATRTDARVEEYASLDEIDNRFLRQTFERMLEDGLIVTQTGSSVFQIRSE
jgi:hypothetical protein